MTSLGLALLAAASLEQAHAAEAGWVVTGGLGGAVNEPGEDGLAGQVSASAGWHPLRLGGPELDLALLLPSGAAIGGRFTGQLRLTSHSLHGTGGAVSLVAGVGVEVGAGHEPRGVARLGLALDAPSSRRVSGRAEGMLHPAGPRGGTFDLRLVARLPGPLTRPTRDPLVWSAEPLCAWVPALEVVPGALASPDPPAAEEAPLPAAERAGPPPGPPLPPGQGLLVVVAWPGDVVRLGDVERAAGGDGVVELTWPAGPVEVVVSGVAGEARRWAGVEAGYATWVRLLGPEALQVRFEQGSSALDAEAVERLRQVAASAAGQRLVVQGSTSPEGSLELNDRLARERADVVVEALVRAGVPRETVYVAAPLVGAAGDPEALRSCRVTLVPADAVREVAP